MRAVGGISLICGLIGAAELGFGFFNQYVGGIIFLALLLVVFVAHDDVLKVRPKR